MKRFATCAMHAFAWCLPLSCAALELAHAATQSTDLPADAGSSGILAFRSDVTVNDDTSLDVREEMTVKSGGKYYRYGFRRIMPIESRDRWDPKYVGEYKRDNGIRVEILEVLEDGRAANYRQGSAWDYSQIFIGDQAQPMAAGERHFVVHYLVHEALRLGPTQDTLYWNALGHERDVPVAEAVLAFHLPEAIPIGAIAIDPRVGGRGVRNPRGAGTELERLDDAPQTIVYRATHIGPRQSLSLAVTWPAGYLHAPKFGAFSRDGWLLAAPSLLFLYYLIGWLCIGPEPKPGAIVTCYEPPAGLSAAAVRYVLTTGSDGRSLAAVLAALAARGCLRVEPTAAGKYKLSRLMGDKASEAKLAPEEGRVLASLFEDGPTIELTAAMDQRNTAQNSRYIFHIQEELSKRLGGLYFTRHAGVIAAGVILTVASAVTLASMAHGREADGAVFFTLWSLGAGLMIGLLLEVTFLPACKSTLRSGGGAWLKLLPGIVAVGAFVWAIVYMLVKLAAGVSPSFALMLAGFLVVNIGWGPWLKRRTPQGRRVLDQIAGFRKFLEEVEGGRLDKLNLASEAPQLLDEHLAYAIALEVKEAWGDHLAQTFFATTVMR
jgi:predicted membrane protein DUF2207